MNTLISLLLVGVFAIGSSGQSFTISYYGYTAQGGSGSVCNKQVDCPNSQMCQMYDYYQYPNIWPPCPHTGFCVCPANNVQLNNGTCVPYQLLNLYQPCSNQVWERYNTPQQRCNGTHVICNTPTYIDQGGVCVTPPVPTFAAVPVVVPSVVTPTCQSVSWLSACDSVKQCCNAAAGLTCQTRGPGSQYQQCLCADSHQIFDQQLGYCRLRVYGDLCTVNEDCNSGLIANRGYECRYGRCRCMNSYEPVDNLYWNETSRTTYLRRICVSSGAVTWAPTGGQCTISPEQYADSNNTRVCHSRAFCHLCYSQRTQSQLNTISSTALTGTCREFTCNGDSDCGYQGSCNRWNGFVDPPCDRGMCDCKNSAGFWKDRFSRCSPMRQLWLGDRCMVGTNALNLWYPNNENWDSDKTCTPDDPWYGGYAGYTWGTIKCQLPLIEDNDGNCVRNDNMQGILYTIVGYNQQCNDADNRLPLLRCDTTKGLACINNVCTCPGTATCANSYAGCSSASTTTYLWDGNMCRIRGIGDTCTNQQDCCGGQCYNGQCTCAQGTTAVQVSNVAINNEGENPVGGATPTTTTICLRNFTLVQKGGECHLNPKTWDCGNYKYGYYNNFLSTQVCQPGLVCLRCPADYNTDDETHGVCRSITPLNIPAGSCGQGELNTAALSGQSSSQQGSNYWSSWYRGGKNAAGRFEGSVVVAVVMMALASML